jgi:CubicO group peptidase (beta-lactamase class C family)
MILFERGLFRVETALAPIVPEFDMPGDTRRRAVTLGMLLAHGSGLPAYARLFERARDPGALLRAAARLPLEADPGSRTAYSDPGFILLGEAIQRLAGESLDSFCRREVFSPLGMGQTCFCPPEAWRNAIPPTEEDRNFRHRVVQGEVQDENAAVLGGVAGHAGLFAPALEVARWAECLLNGGTPLFRRDTVARFTTRQAESSRALGWDTPTPPSQSGKYLSARAYGHLGYAGTSLWIDPERGLSITLLTNRTWPDRSSLLIKQFRPAFHDAVVEALG